MKRDCIDCRTLIDRGRNGHRLRCVPCKKRAIRSNHQRYYLLNRKKLNEYKRKYYHTREKILTEKKNAFLLNASYEEMKKRLNPASILDSFYEKRYERSKHLLRMIEKTNKRKEGTAL